MRALELEQERKAAWEKKKVEILIEHSQQWKQANELARFISAVEERMTHKGEVEPEISEWLQWSKEVQRSLDPLEEGVESLLSQYELPSIDEIPNRKAEKNRFCPAEIKYIF